MRNLILACVLLFTACSIEDDGEIFDEDVSVSGDLPDDAEARTTCLLGTPVEVVVWLRIWEGRSGFQTGCDNNIAVEIDGNVVPRFNCVQGSLGYPGIYKATVNADGGLYSVDVTATDGRRISIGQEFALTTAECLGGQAWRYVTVEVIPPCP